MQEFEKYNGLAGHIERMAVTGVVGSSQEWFEFLEELNTVLLVLGGEDNTEAFVAV